MQYARVTDLGDLRDELFRRIRKKHSLGDKGSYNVLAKKLHMGRGVVHRLENGSDMKASSLLKLANEAGLSFDGIMGGLETESIDANSVQLKKERIGVLGYIAAGSGIIERIEEDDPEYVEYEGIREVFEDHSLWGLGEGPMQLIGIRGDSMTPRFKPNSILAARRLGYEVDISAIPINSFVILQDTYEGEMTFKIFDYIEDEGEIIRVIGRAVNEDYELMKMKPDEVRVSHIVYGAIDKLL